MWSTKKREKISKTNFSIFPSVKSSLFITNFFVYGEKKFYFLYSLSQEGMRKITEEPKSVRLNWLLYWFISTLFPSFSNSSERSFLGSLSVEKFADVGAFKNTSHIKWTIRIKFDVIESQGYTTWGRKNVSAIYKLDKTRQA